MQKCWCKKRKNFGVKNKTFGLGTNWCKNFDIKKIGGQNEQNIDVKYPPSQGSYNPTPETIEAGCNSNKYFDL